jgi:hypothetical protein
VQVTLASHRSPMAASNEDFIAATAGVVTVLDGATVPPRLATGCVHGTAWFTNRLGSLLLELAADRERALADCLAQAITELAALHGPRCDPRHPGGPSATVAVLRERYDQVDFLVLGDSTILLDGMEGLQIMTDDRLERVARRERDAMLMHATGSAAQGPLREHLITEQRCRRNRPGGYWIASSDPAAARHGLAGVVQRRALRRAGVLSDGATRLVDRFRLLSWSELLDLLDVQGPEALVARVRLAEVSDPFGRRWPRGKRHDDASAAFCRF